MKKSELFYDVLHKVVEVCEVREQDVLNSMKAQAVVDARSLVVQYCRRLGLSNEDIAFSVLKSMGEPISYDVIRKKSKMIDNLFRGYSDRCIQSHAYCLMSKDISLWCREHFEVSW